MITKESWQYLVSVYGMETLYSLDCESCWHDFACETLEAHQEMVEQLIKEEYLNV